MVAESVSGATTFDLGLRDQVLAALSTSGYEASIPVLPTGAGHDAGVLADAGVPSAMLFVRNPTGISHSPDEYAEREDCIAGVHALAAVMRNLG